MRYKKYPCKGSCKRKSCETIRENIVSWYQTVVSSLPQMTVFRHRRPKTEFNIRPHRQPGNKTSMVVLFSLALISPPFLPLICIILPFCSLRMALRKEGRLLAFQDCICHVFDSNGHVSEWRISVHAQSVLAAGQKHHNSSPLASACNMVTNKDLKR